MTPVLVDPGAGPVILGFPHDGTHVPEAVAADLNERGRGLADTDWHIHRLYSGLLPDATTVRAVFHRYVIDANRDPAGVSLYPGRNTTDLVPLTDFDGEPIWARPPSPEAIAARHSDWHAPYHAALAAEIARVTATHGVAVVFDCHSIRSEIPYLFDGRLPDLNIGDNDGRTCAADLTRAVAAIAAAATGFSHVVNGRFKGGWTTRHYGRPQDGVHAIQLELAQSTYLAAEAPPFAFDPARAARLRPVLAAALARIDALGRSGALS